MKSLFSILLIIGYASAASGCIESPLLKHSKAGSDLPIRFAQANTKCRLPFSNAALCASLEWETIPSDERRGSFLLRFWNLKLGNENGPYVTPENPIFVKLWMPSMGHGSSPVRVETLLDSGKVAIPGIFRVSEVFFVMGGEWEIWIQLRDGTVVRDQAKIDYAI